MAIGSPALINQSSPSPHTAFVRDALANAGSERNANEARVQAESQARQQAESRSRAAPPPGQGSRVDITA